MFVHKMWNDHELSKMVNGGVPFPMLSDAGGRVGSVYGVYDEDAGAFPSGWKPGKKTLRPGPDLVGNVWKEWKTEMAFD